MSSRLNRKLFLIWLKKARFSNVSKNAVKKDLLEELSSCVVFSFIGEDIKDTELVISENRLTSLITFLQSDSISANKQNVERLSDDALLNWNKTIEQIWKEISQGQRVLETAPSSVTVSPILNTRDLQQPKVHSDSKDQ
jgi:hypothetical protein